MRREEIRDLFSLYCVAQSAAYDRAEFSMYLIGRGATRSLYELLAEDRKTHAHLFDIQVEGTEQALEFRAHQAGTNTDAQAVSAAFQYASKIIETNAYKNNKRFRLELKASSAALYQDRGDG